ncbi:MAG: ATP-binding protein [Candidatus Omnitrophota bacterium]|jgi:signal transduction histidine kinase
MNAFAFSGLLVLVSSLFFGFFVFFKNTKNRVNQIWGIFSLAVALWGLAGLRIGLIPEEGRALAVFWWRITYLGIIFIPVLFYHFVYLWLGLKRKILLYLFYLWGFFYVILEWTPWADLFIGYDNMRLVFSSFYVVGPKPLFNFFVFCWYAIAIYSHYELYAAFKKTTGLKRIQVKYFFLATAIGFLGGGFSFSMCFGANIYPYYNFTVPLYPAIMAYTILRYNLMDIKVAITRTSIFVVIYTLVLGLPFAIVGWFRGLLTGWFGSLWWAWPLGLMAALATVGPFIYIYIIRRAEDRLLKEQKRYQNTLRQVSLGMTRIRNLRKLLDLITHIITKTVRISYAAIYLYDRETDKYVLRVSRDKGRVPLPELNPDNALIDWLLLERRVLIYEEIKRQAQDSPDPVYVQLEETMRLLTASVVIPCYLEDKFLGFIVLGDKLSGQIYTQEDLSVFQVLASQAALAIENAEFYEETKKIHEQIAQAEKMATVGTMADGLSHQINNRFYALSLIAGDTIDTIKMIDTSKCTPEVKEAFEQVNHALERIQANVIQGGEVVKGVLKYTRKGEENFQALSLDQILDATLEMVQYKVTLSELDIVRNYPKDTPKIKGNLTQLEEVFFNCIDNAYEAITERHTLLKEEGFRGRISFSAQPKNNKLEIVIEDNGMGIKDSSQKKIFTPFFTTKTSTRRGTGLGLYVINKIITDAHEGKIYFESEYKVGTRFIIELPIAEE